MIRTLSILLGLCLLAPMVGRAETSSWGAPSADTCAAQLEPKTPYEQALAAVSDAIPSYLLLHWYHNPNEVLQKVAADHSPWWTDISERLTEPKNFDLSKVKPHVLASENGSQELRAVRINFDSRALGVFQRLVANYARAMQEIPGLELWIVHRDADRALLESQHLLRASALQGRIKLISTSSQGLTLWAQDGSKPLEGMAGTLVQNSGVFVKKKAYAEVAGALGDAGLAKILESDLPFEGGNVIVGARHVLMGADTINHAMIVYGLSRQEVLRAYGIQFGRPVLEVGVPDPQSTGADKRLLAPAFHIDLAMALGRDLRRPDKREVVFLQSPVLMLKEVFGLESVGAMSGNEFLPAFDRGLREFVERENRSARKISPTLLSFIKAVAAAKKDLFEEEVEVRRLAQLLTAKGYAIEWLPGFNNKTPAPPPNVVNPPLKSFNYTNVIFSGSVVLVPKLGVEMLDRAVFKVYERLGYKVVPMDAAELSIPLMGGPRCLSETFRQ